VISIFFHINTSSRLEKDSIKAGISFLSKEFSMISLNKLEDEVVEGFQKMKNNWYTASIKQANEFLGMDAVMTPEHLADQNLLRGNQFSPDSSQRMPGMVSDVRKIDQERTEPIRVSRCGEEPGGGGCGSDLQECGIWRNYSVPINGENYLAYECSKCKHSVKPFDIKYTKKPKKKRKKRQKSKRLSQRITLRKSYTIAATPAIPMSTEYNNPMNQMVGRTDLSEDARVIPWSKMDEYATEEYDDWKQKNRKKQKIIKIKGKDGSERYIRIEKVDTGGNAVAPANAYKVKGRRKKDPRYNPGKPWKQNPGAWPHNRDDNEGWYQSGMDKNRFNSDMRERVVPWSTYVQERGNLGLLKPY